MYDLCKRLVCSRPLQGKSLACIVISMFSPSTSNVVQRKYKAAGTENVLFISTIQECRLLRVGDIFTSDKRALVHKCTALVPFSSSRVITKINMVLLRRETLSSLPEKKIQFDSCDKNYFALSCTISCTKINQC